MTRHISLLPLYLLLHLGALPLYSQWSEDFSSGDLGQGTVWEGDLSHFLINATKELQLMAPSAGTSYLYTRQWIPDSVRWDFVFRLDFSPSNTNQVGMFLMADTTDLSIANGYYLEAGETGSADAIKFFRLSNGQKTLLASGASGALGGTTAMMRGRMERTALGEWTLWSDYTGGKNYSEDFTVTETVHASGKHLYFGVVCIYTATRTDKFFFDDFGINPLLPDVDPPKLVDVSVVDDQELMVSFDEALRETEASDPDSYLLEPLAGPPSLVVWSPVQPEQVRLVWASPLQQFTAYNLSAFGMADIAGNVADTLQFAFTFLQPVTPKPGQLLINEFMADPNPPAGLPDAEYIELFNPSELLLNLTGLRIATSSAGTNLPAYTLYPDSFLILTRPEFVDLFTPFGPTLAVPSLPTLPNEGTSLRLETLTGTVLHEVPYTSQWHSSTLKREGGWSLELVSPDLRCALTGNWRSAQAPAGGTPGQKNSVFQAAVDSTGPVLRRIWPASSERLILTFNEILHPLPDPSWLSLDPNIPIIQMGIIDGGNRVEIVLGQPIEPGQVLWIQPTNALSDCLGNSATLQNPIPVSLPENPGPGDLLINEILFNPPTGGADFIEIYNASDKTFALQNLLLGNMQPGKEEVRPVHLEALCFPGQYMVFTSDTGFLSGYWRDVDPAFVFQVTTPAWLNESGNATLFRLDGPDQILLDQMDYHENMHFTLLNDVKGVSLERLSPELPAGDAENWHSAAEEVGFATPTRQNSQYISHKEPEKGPFVLESSRFSPDGDGWQDQMVITYQFQDPGTVLNARVFDRQGRQIRILANTKYLGREGILTWSGEHDEGYAVGPGAYIIWLETYDLKGRVKQYKLPVILALPLK